ncbi:MAG: hypothetical protein WBB69_14440 [Anaerolineales bacterium]
MNTENKNATIFEDVKVNVKFILAALWTGHFLLWSFGDMASLLQKMNEPIDNNLLLFVAVPLALIQALMIYFSLAGKAKYMRWANIILALVFAVFNIVFISEAQFGWVYLLGAGYLLFNILIVWQAWKWSK